MFATRVVALIAMAIWVPVNWEILAMIKFGKKACIVNLLKLIFKKLIMLLHINLSCQASINIDRCVTQMENYEAVSWVCGHHVYFSIWNPIWLTKSSPALKRDISKAQDPFDTAAMHLGSATGHIQITISAACVLFLWRKVLYSMYFLWKMDWHLSSVRPTPLLSVGSVALSVLSLFDFL